VYINQPFVGSIEAKKACSSKENAAGIPFFKIVGNSDNLCFQTTEQARIVI